MVTSTSFCFDCQRHSWDKWVMHWIRREHFPVPRGDSRWRRPRPKVWRTIRTGRLSERKTRDRCRKFCNDRPNLNAVIRMINIVLVLLNNKRNCMENVTKCLLNNRWGERIAIWRCIHWCVWSPRSVGGAAGHMVLGMDEREICNKSFTLFRNRMPGWSKDQSQPQRGMYSR